MADSAFFPSPSNDTHARPNSGKAPLCHVRFTFFNCLVPKHTHAPFPFQINITKTSFPQHVQKIKLSNVEELKIEADAIAYLTSLKSIELVNVGILTLLGRSLALGHESGPIALRIHHVKSLQMYQETFANWRNYRSEINIEDVEKCIMSQLTIAPSTTVGSLNLAHVSSLVIGHDAIGRDSVIENMWVTEISDLSVETGAFALNITIQVMQFVDVKTFSIQAGAFARNSSIHSAVVEHVPHLAIDSGAIEADIDELNIRHVTMAACDDNTFGSTIKSMTVAFSHINTTKAGCISASTGNGWKDLSIKNSQLDIIEEYAIQGTISHVEIEESKFGTIETRGFSLNVAKFSVQRSSMREVAGKALMVSAGEGITLFKCEIDILRQHAFSSLKLKSGAAGHIIIQSMTVKHPEKNLMAFNDGTKFGVSGLDLGIPCTCDVETLAQELGLASSMPGGDLKQSFWFSQTRCVSSDTTRPTLAEFHSENCRGPTTTTGTPATSTDSSSLMGREGDSGPPPVPMPDPREPPRSQQIRTGGTNTWFLLGLLIAMSLIMLITIAVFLVCRRQEHFLICRRELRHNRSVSCLSTPGTFSHLPT